MDLLACIVSQDALSEVVKLYPPMKLKVFVDDITAFLEGRSKESPEIAEMVTRAMSMEVAEKAESCRSQKGREEGKSKVTASCSYLEEKFQALWQKRVSMLCKHCGNIRFGIEDERRSWEQTRRREEEGAT